MTDIKKRFDKNFDTKGIFSHDTDYKNLLEEIKLKLKAAQLRAAIAVNIELICFYWEIGALILSKEKTGKWGDKIYDVLAHDRAASFPDTKGFSKTNLKYMRLFASHYPKKEFSQALPDQLTWTHHIVLAQINYYSKFYDNYFFVQNFIQI